MNEGRLGYTARNIPDRLPREAYADNFLGRLQLKLQEERIGYIQVEKGDDAALLLDRIYQDREGKDHRPEGDAQMAILPGSLLFAKKVSREAEEDALKQLDSLTDFGTSLIAINMENIETGGDGSQAIIHRLEEAAKDPLGPSIVFVGSHPWERPEEVNAKEPDPADEMMEDSKAGDIDLSDPNVLADTTVADPYEGWELEESEPVQASEVTRLIRFGGVIDRAGTSLTFINEPEEAKLLPPPVPNANSKKPTLQTRLKITEDTYAEVVPRPLGESRLGELGQANKDQDVVIRTDTSK
jgi:hypothetical protein